jgi:hypothetical protein
MSNMMVRKQIYLPRRQNQFLKRRAKQAGISEAEVIRRALERDEKMADTQVMGNIAGWEQIQQFVKERQVKYAGKGKPVQWNRQDLYDEDAKSGQAKKK